MKPNPILIAVIGLVLAAVFYAKNNTPDTVQLAVALAPPAAIIIDANNDSCTSGNPSLYSSCAQACELNPYSCAKTIFKHIQSQGFIERRILNPNTIEQKPNIQTPMHGLFVPTWVNPQLHQAIITAVANPFAKVKMPAWSISAKLNNNPGKNENPAPNKLDWATVMYKIPGYCPERIFPQEDSQCLGGEWFWFLHRFGEFQAFEYVAHNNASVPAWGKAETFCLDCHAAVANDDWLWITHDQIRRAQQLAASVHSDGEKPGTEGTYAYLCDDINTLS